MNSIRRPGGPAWMLAGLFVSLSACAPDEPDPDLEAPPTPDARGAEALVEDLPAAIARDWQDIVLGDTLRALVVDNSTSYFVYRGEPMGFEFRALRRFAADHGLELAVTIVRDRTELFRRLNRGEGDVVAARLVPADAYSGAVSLSRGLYRTRPSVVQRTGPPDPEPLPEAADTLIDDDAVSTSAGTTMLRVRRVRRPHELAGTRVHLPYASEYVDRLVELSDTFGETIEVVEVEDALSAEHLFRRVSSGEIALTVSQRNVAELREDYYDNLEVAPDAGPTHPVVWAMRTTSPILRELVDGWIERHSAPGALLDRLYDTYFVDRNGYLERVTSEYLTSETGRLSRFDELLYHHADSLGWDWRLLASQAFQESRFNPRARSWAGAEGLLQLMPGTARDMGVRNAYDPEQNVRGAVRYLEWLEARWSDRIADPDERLRFVLASYNAGTGHVEDARRLARKHGDDPDRWDEVAYWLLQLSKRDVRRDPVVRYGFVRGIEPVTYVARVLERFDHYREFVAEVPAALEG